MIKFIIPKGHIMRHFPGSGEPGSVFFAKSPADLLTAAAHEFPDVFKDAVPDPADGRKRLSFVSEKAIGLCNVVALSDLTAEEAASMTEEDRDGCLARVVKTKRAFPTREFQVILGEDNTVITLFPGPLAPPLPKRGDHSEFWDNHVFIVQD